MPAVLYLAVARGDPALTAGWAIPAATDIALVNYRGTLPDGTVFDQGQQKPFQVDGVIPGCSVALQKMQKQAT